MQERRRRPRAGAELGIIALVLGVLFVVLSAAITMGFDGIDRVLPPGPYPAAATLGQMVEQVAKPSISIAIGVLITLFLVWRGWRHEALLVLATVGLAGATGAVAKMIISRDRPPGAEVGQLDLAASFPSGHVTMAAAMLLSLAFITSEPGTRKRRLSVLAAIVLVLVVGLGRVVGGAHFVSDVVGGLLVGAAVTCLAEWLLGVRWHVSPAILTRWLRGRPGPA